MRRCLFFVCLAIWLPACQTERSLEDPSQTHFIKFYGKDGDQTGRDLVVLPDGSMVLLGTSRATETLVGSQLYVTRVDSKGAIMWENEFGGNNDEEARDIELTSSGDLVIVGNAFDDTGSRDVMIVTVDAATGQSLFSAVHQVVDSLGAPTQKDEDVSTVTETSDGFIIAGSTTYVTNKTLIPGTASRDAMKMRVNSDLSLYAATWNQTTGYKAEDNAFKIVPALPAGPGSFYLFGTTNTVAPGHSSNDYNFWIVILGANGDPFNSADFSSYEPSDEKMTSFCFSTTGYFTAGTYESAGSSQDIFIAETALPDISNGFDPPFRQKSLGLTLGSALSGRTSITASINSGFLLLTEENGFNANQNWLLTRLKTDGSPLWKLPIIFGGEGLDEAGAVQELPDGRIVIIGTMRTGRPDVGEFKMTLVKVSKDGKFEK